MESLLDAVDEYEKDTENRKPKQQQCRTKQGNDIETDSEQLQNSRINSRGKWLKFYFCYIKRFHTYTEM